MDIPTRRFETNREIDSYGTWDSTDSQYMDFVELLIALRSCSVNSGKGRLRDMPIRILG